MNESNHRFLWTDREENVFKKIILLMRMSSVHTFLIESCISV